MQTPFVTVLLPAYNAGPYIAEAIQSIIGQTYTNFELLIINDCSTDTTEEVIKSFTDPRIRYIKNAQNSGLIYNLNLGIAEAKGVYIVRMDADDISLPTRIDEQVAFMESSPGVGICGSNFQAIGSASNMGIYEQEGNAIKLRMLYQCHFCHPTVIIRKSVLDDNNLRYDNGFVHAEDYELWSRMAFVTGFANIGKVLLHYRVHGESVSQKHAIEQAQNSGRVIHAIFSRIGLEIPAPVIPLWVKTCYAEFDLSPDEILSIEKLMLGLLLANETAQYVKQEYLEAFLAEKWFNLCYNNIKVKQVQKLFKQSPVSGLVPQALRLKLRVKALI